MATEKDPTLTPEHEAAEQMLKDAGYVDSSLLEVAAPPAPEPPAAAPPEPPAPPAAPAPVTLSAEEAAALREAADRGRWAEREKERADQERDARQRLEGELLRWRPAPATPHPAGVQKEPTPDEKSALEWLERALPGLLPQILAKLPEEALAAHPAFRKRDLALLAIRDATDQAMFLSQFEPKQRAAVRTHVLPRLMTQRQSTGYTKNYEDLWEEERKMVQERAEIYGVSTAPPAPSATPPAVKVPQAPVPPNLAGVHGTVPKPTSTVPPLTLDEMRVFGQA